MANAKLDIDISAFNANVKTATGILKGLDAEMKATDATFKATGNSEKQLADKTKVLNSQIRVQKGIIDQAKQALDALSKQGVAEADAEYQKWYATLMKATAGMNNAQAELNALNGSTLEAASGAEQLTTGLNGISKKISLGQVISGIDKITSSLEAAGKKAVELGKDIWNNIMDSARLADDIATQARAFDMTPEKYQQYKGVFDTIGEVTIQEWDSVRRKVEKAMEAPSKDQIDIISALGFGGMVGGKGSVEEEAIRLTADNWEDAFWGVATELKNRVESGDISLATADVWGEAMFGKKYSHLKSLIDMGQEAFIAALGKQNVASDEAIEKDAALNDAVIKLQESYDALKMEITSGLAPALTDAATALDGLLGKVLEYLQSEKGKEMLQSLSDSVSKLFEDLGNIDPESVVESFTSVFNSLIDGLKWIVDNKDTLIAALRAVVVGWGALKLTGGALDILNLVNGIKGLTGGGVAAAAGQAGSTTGAPWASSFAASVAKTLPFLAPFLLGADAIVNDQKMLAEWAANGAQAQQDYSTKSALYSGQEMFGIWDTLTRYSFATGNGPEDQDKLIEFAHHYVSWMNDTVADPMLDALTEQMSQEGFDNFDDIMTRIVNGEQFYSNEDLAALSKAIDDAIKAAEEIMKPQVDVDVKAPDDAAEVISQQIGTVPVNVTPVLYNASALAGILGGLPGFANGIQSVPYDGMLARLHKGERVVPAREVASRSFSSNLYVENMNMGGGLSADALAAAIAGRNRRMMAGYGS